MTEMSIFEKAIGQLSTGFATKYYRDTHTYSCHAIAQVEPGGLGAFYRGPMEEYARSWFNNRFEESGDYLDETHYPEVFSDDPTTARRARIKRQYNRALWLTLMDLLYETGESPL